MCISVIKNVLTGCGCIDSHLNGGISPESVTLVYGEPETGKSTLAMQCAVNCAMQGYKTLFVDCDNTFSAKRLSQVASGKFEEIADRIILIRPADFREQTAVIDRISEYTAKNFGLVVIDTFNSLYRAKVAETSGKAFGPNRELNRQLAILAQTAKTQKMPIVITSQVRSVLDDSYHSVAPVATRVLKFWADTIIAMKPTENPQTIKAVLEKTRENVQEATCYLRIDETGIRDSAFLQ
jgi:DNA repair and recombination protein RadB